MKLWSDSIAKKCKIPPLYSTEDVKLKDRLIVAKFFSPYSNWTWYVVEGNRHEDVNNDWLFFGLVEGFEKEWGYFTLGELEQAKKGDLPLVERDLYWTPITVAEAGLA